MSFLPIKFFVPGTPATAGSKRAFVNKATGKAAIVDTCKQGPAWRDRVQLHARSAIKGIEAFNELLDEPVELKVVFYSVRPRGHYRNSKKYPGLKPDAPRWPTRKPDATKLLRAVEDALKGIVWRDDSLVVVQNVIKVYADKPGALVTISSPLYPSDYLENRRSKIMAVLDEECGA